MKTENKINNKNKIKELKAARDAAWETYKLSDNSNDAAWVYYLDTVKDWYTFIDACRVEDNKIKTIQIKNSDGIIFTYSTENNTLKKTLKKAVIEKFDLINAELTHAKLKGAELTGANLTGANLTVAKLRGANLRSADLRRADLRDADLRNTNFRGADLRGADLTGANLRLADLRFADLRGAIYTEVQIKSVFTYKTTIFQN